MTQNTVPVTVTLPKPPEGWEWQLAGKGELYEGPIPTGIADLRLRRIQPPERTVMVPMRESDADALSASPASDMAFERLCRIADAAAKALAKLDASDTAATAEEAARPGLPDVVRARDEIQEHADDPR